MTVCSKCSARAPSPPGKFCPRCGHAYTPHPAGVVPVHLERRGTLLNPLVLVSVVVIIAGGLLAGLGEFSLGVALLAVGVPCLLIATVRSLSR